MDRYAHILPGWMNGSQMVSMRSPAPPDADGGQLVALRKVGRPGLPGSTNCGRLLASCHGRRAEPEGLRNSPDIDLVG